MHAAETDDKNQSDCFAMVAQHLNSLADQVERAMTDFREDGARHSGRGEHARRLN